MCLWRYYLLGGCRLHQRKVFGLVEGVRDQSHPSSGADNDLYSVLVQFDVKPCELVCFVMKKGLRNLPLGSGHRDAGDSGVSFPFRAFLQNPLKRTLRLNACFAR